MQVAITLGAILSCTWEHQKIKWGSHTFSARIHPSTHIPGLAEGSLLTQRSHACTTSFDTGLLASVTSSYCFVWAGKMCRLLTPDFSAAWWLPATSLSPSWVTVPQRAEEAQSGLVGIPWEVGEVAAPTPDHARLDWPPMGCWTPFPS